MAESTGVLSSQSATSSSQNESFFTALRGLHTEAHLVSDAKSTVGVLKQILETSDTRSAVVAGLPTPARLLAESALKGVKYVFVENLKPGEAVDVISKADVGITWAQFAAARSGALVEITFDDAVKLASCLPRVNVILLSSRTLLPNLEDAVAKIAGILKSEEAGRKPIISLISGPSKTADIELRLVYGVHGPHTLHVVMLDWI